MRKPYKGIVIRWRRFNAVVAVLFCFSLVVIAIGQLRNHTSNPFAAYFFMTLGIISSLYFFQFVIQPKLIIRGCKEGIIFLLTRKLVPNYFKELLVDWDNIHSIQRRIVETYNTNNQIIQQEVLEIKFVPGFNLNNLGHTEAVLEVPEDGNFIFIPTSIMSVSIETAIKKLTTMHQLYK